MQWMGGGDIKLMTAGALWVGLQNLPDFLFIVALLGGVFSFFMLVVRKLVPFIPKITKTADVPRILRDGEPIPYGVAIALGFLFMLLNGKVPAVL
jgi:prepilin peptidase CpaA